MKKGISLKSLALVCGVGAMGEGCKGNLVPLTDAQWDQVHIAVDKAERDTIVAIDIAKKADARAVFGVEGSGIGDFEASVKKTIHFLRNLEDRERIYGYDELGFSLEQKGEALAYYSPREEYIAIDVNGHGEGSYLEDVFTLGGVLMHETAHEFFGEHGPGMTTASELSPENCLTFAIEKKDFPFLIQEYIDFAEEFYFYSGSRNLDAIESVLGSLEEEDSSEEDRIVLEEKVDDELGNFARSFIDLDREAWIQTTSNRLDDKYYAKYLGITQQEIEDIFREGSMSGEYERNRERYSALIERYDAYLESQESEIQRAREKETRGKHATRDEYTIKRR